MTFTADTTLDRPDAVRPWRAEGNANFRSEPTRDILRLPPPVGRIANRQKYPSRVRRHFVMSVMLLAASMALGLGAMITGWETLIYISQGLFFGGGVMLSISLLNASRSTRVTSPTGSSYNGWVPRQAN